MGCSSTVTAVSRSSSSISFEPWSIRARAPGAKERVDEGSSIVALERLRSRDAELEVAELDHVAFADGGVLTVFLFTNVPLRLPRSRMRSRPSCW